MTNNTNATTREDESAAGLLWVEDTQHAPIAAPTQFGGERWDKQLTTLVERAERDGIPLRTDSGLYVIELDANGSTGQRLGALLKFTAQHPTRRLYVPGSVFADLSPADRAMHINTLHVHETELIICDE